MLVYMEWLQCRTVGGFEIESLGVPVITVGGFEIESLGVPVITVGGFEIESLGVPVIRADKAVVISHLLLQAPVGYKNLCWTISERVFKINCQMKYYTLLACRGLIVIISLPSKTLIVFDVTYIA